MDIDLNLMRHIELGYTFPPGVSEKIYPLTKEDIPEVTSLGSKAEAYLSAGWDWVKENRVMVAGLAVGVVMVGLLLRRR